MNAWPITMQDVLEARRRLSPHLAPTPLRAYPALDAAVGAGIRVLVKHENHNPTNAFKARNGLAAMTALPDDARRRGVVTASTGNHGQGVAWAGRLLGVRVAVCVPVGNNPEKNEALRGLGAELIETGRDYDEALGAARALARERGATMIHSTDDPMVIAGAATLALEILEAEPRLDALVLAVGGGSQAVGALTVARALAPRLRVYGVQAEGAAAIHDSWHAGRPIERPAAATFAEGIATRRPYELTFGALREGLAGFVTVSEGELAEAIRLVLRTTHNLVEGAGAAGLAGLLKLREVLAGLRVGVVLSGANIDAGTLRRVLNREL
ncbi:MAG TPA: threonine/serine dehydratase [Thermodesulfobacteriota bacterium]|nr:threonine/serine dehydratase [Thermodesulfobacteriota bacterium]